MRQTITNNFHKIALPTLVLSTIFLFLTQMGMPVYGKGKVHKYRHVKGTHDAYSYVTGLPNADLISTPHAYPAPSGEEDVELLPETLARVKVALGEDCKINSRDNVLNQIADQNGKWWFSQVNGADKASGVSHYIDMTYTDTTGHVAYAGAAFDIVLTNIEVFKRYPQQSASRPSW